MSASATEPSRPEGQRLAITAEALYLANLLLLPGIAFVALALLFRRRSKDAPPLAAAHLEQTYSASLWAGVLLVIVNALIILLGGYRAPYVWLLVIIYFTLCHSGLVLIGMLGLAKAMAGQCLRFPLVGRDLPHACSQLR